MQHSWSEDVKEAPFPQSSSLLYGGVIYELSWGGPNKYSNKITDKSIDKWIKKQIMFWNDISQFFRRRGSEHCWIVPETKSRGLFNNIHFAFGEYFFIIIAHELSKYVVDSVNKESIFCCNCADYSYQDEHEVLKGLFKSISKNFMSFFQKVFRQTQ